MVASLPSRATEPVIHADTEFISGWEFVSVSAGSGGSFSAAPQGVGGNPGAYLELTTAVNGDCSFIFGLAIKTSATHDPATQGPLGWVDYAEDVTIIEGFGSGQATGPALRQGGKLYVSRGLATGPDQTWSQRGKSKLLAKDFVQVVEGDCSRATDDSQHPDFSWDGSAIEFGFFRANSQIDGYGAYSIIGAIDNWSVSIQAFNYVAMGDSYSAGEGLGSYLSGTDLRGVNECHRSTSAYGFQVRYSGISLRPENFLPCSGARSFNLWPAPYGVSPLKARHEAPQLERHYPPPHNGVTVVGAGTDLVTLTIGGNDLGFDEILRLCILAAGQDCSAPTFRPWLELGDQRSLRQVVADRMSIVRSAATSTHSYIKNQAGNATVFAHGYPRLFGVGACGALDESETSWLNSVAHQLNRNLACAASQSGVHFVSVTNAFTGHGDCSPSSWIFPLSLVGRFQPWAGSFHPRGLGHRAYAATLDARIDYLVKIGQPLRQTGIPENPPPSTPANCASRAPEPDSPAPSLGALSVSAVGSPPCDSRGAYVPSQQIRVEGDSFAANASVMIHLTTESYDSNFANASADASGRLDATITLPAGAPTSTRAMIKAFGAGADGENRLALAPIGLSTSFTADADGDTIPDPCDLCPASIDSSPVDSDGDGLGDLCDLCPTDLENDADADGLCAEFDPCPWDALNDSDGDGFCEVDDNCPLDANPDQADLDGDRHGDPCDPAPADGGAFAIPGEVREVMFEPDGTTLTWTSAVESAGALTVHDIVRDALANLPVGSGGACIGSAISVDSIVDPTLPAAGQGFWYLVRARNAIDLGSYGQQSDGLERISTTCP